LAPTIMIGTSVPGCRSVLTSLTQSSNLTNVEGRDRSNTRMIPFAPPLAEETKSLKRL
jgi:hypothetical protein